MWYGTCNDCEYAYNYAYQGDAMPIGETDLQALESVCPELFDQFGKSAVELTIRWATNDLNIPARSWRWAAVLLRLEANQRSDREFWSSPQSGGAMPELRAQLANDLLLDDVRSSSQPIPGIQHDSRAHNHTRTDNKFHRCRQSA